MVVCNEQVALANFGTVHKEYFIGFDEWHLMFAHSSDDWTIRIEKRHIPHAIRFMSPVK